MNTDQHQILYPRAWIYFGLAFLVTIAGFFPSYFSRLGETSAAHHFHGITATLWMLILVLQPLLYRFGKLHWHRIIGRTTLLLVPMLVVGGLIMVHMMLNSERYPPNLPEQLAFIDFFVITQFVAFYILALQNVHDTQLHARYMAATIFGPLIPALTRFLFVFPWISSFSMSLHISYLLVEFVILILIFHDYRQGKVRLPYKLALGLMVTQHVMMHFAGTWEWWHWLMEIYAGIPG